MSTAARFFYALVTSGVIMAIYEAFPLGSNRTPFIERGYWVLFAILCYIAARVS